jgi:hypothetical protein
VACLRGLEQPGVVARAQRELGWLEGTEGWELRLAPAGRLDLGTQPPLLEGGVQAEGLISPSAGARLDLRWGPAELALAPRAEAQVGPGFEPGLRWEEAWLGLEVPLEGGGRAGLGGGLRDRFLGPGRWGSLMLSDEARPAPLGAFFVEHRAGPLGLLRAEAGAGWLDGERSDVQEPGWLILDMRWMPLPLVELGASRVGIFGGQGRPLPRVGQLILPTQPHVYDDPEQVEADQDELAALDARLLLPLGRWFGGPARSGDYVEIWWQYGAEDLVVNRLGGLPVPSLAGVANLGGAELSLGHWLVDAEAARILDDYFRWYTGHRIYHQGFVREGLCMGHPSCGDSITWNAGLTYVGEERGAGLELSRRLRLGVVGAQGDSLFARMSPEEAWGGSLRWMGFLEERPWSARLRMERVQGLEFNPGAEEWRWGIELEGG